MTWFKVDDGFHASHKVMAIPRGIRLSAVGLWTIAGSWSAAEELDGLVPDYMLDEWGATTELVDALVNAGLWQAVDEGVGFCNWAEYQPTRKDLEEKREAERLRKAEWRRRKNESRPAGVTAGQTRDTRGTDVLVPSTPTRPDPTRPDPTRPTIPEGDAHALPPFCPKHMPKGPNGQSCRACGDAKMARIAQEAAWKARPTPLPPRIGTPPRLCPDGRHQLLADGTCVRCEYRTMEVV